MKTRHYGGGSIASKTGMPPLKTRPATPHGQRGVILLITLIMLVAMTLAAIGLMRSVDTGNMIAGNLAFKQATLNATDTGLSSAIAAMGTLPNLNNDAPASAYYSSPVSPCEVLGLTTTTSPNNINGTACPTQQTESTWWTSFNWSANASPPQLVVDPTNGGTIATVQYVIHRMCLMSNQLPANQATPIGAQIQFCDSSLIVPPCHVGGGQACPPNLVVYLYRVTIRAVGVRNSVSYTQTMVLKG